MPRKQNGFGSSKSLSFKGSGRVDRGKGVGAAGTYPGNRRYGTSVTRTVIEKWNLDSDWTKWRTGYELWNQAFYSLLRREAELDPNYEGPIPIYDPGLPIVESNLPTDINFDPTKEITAGNEPYAIAQLLSILYQGTDYPTNVRFYGWEFPTMNSDVNTHYVAKREPLKVNLETGAPEDISLGFITSVLNDELKYPEQKQYGEIWVKGTPNLRGRLLLQMVNERLTDGVTTATMKYLLGEPSDICEQGEPAIYLGKTAPEDVRDSTDAPLEPTIVKVSFNKANVVIPETQTTYRVNQGLSTYRQTPTAIDLDNNPNELIGKIVYLPDFFKDLNVADFEQIAFIEDETYFAAGIADISEASQIYVLDPGVSLLPPSMYDITSLPQILTATNGTSLITGTYIFRKSDYQRFFGKTYLTASLVEERIETASYSVFPFVIQDVRVSGDTIELTSTPFNSEIQMYPPLTANGTLIFSDKSFTKTVPSNKPGFNYDYYPDINPWQDETFIAGQPIEPAITYTCSCPSHSKSILAVPQSTENEGQRLVNRQRRYPLPTVLSQDKFDGAGSQSAAGKIASWQTAADRLVVPTCKHSIAAMFADGVRVIESNQYPTQEARDEFEEKLYKKLMQYDNDFKQSFDRSGLSLTEIVFALAQGLNLDNTETAYVVLNSN